MNICSYKCYILTDFLPDAALNYCNYVPVPVKILLAFTKDQIDNHVVLSKQFGAVKSER